MVLFHVLVRLGGLLVAVLGSTSAAAQSQPATFNRDVAPILWAHCTSCHRPGQIAPFSLLTFEEARPQARAILRAIATRRMPPWKPEPGYAEFEGVRRLSEQGDRHAAELGRK